MTKLCPRGKAAAKRKFKVYPSAFANAYASKICAGKIKDPSGVKRKDFRGPKPAKAMGGRIKAPPRPQKQFKKRGTAKSQTEIQMDRKKFEKPRQPVKGMMGGGLTEATARLKRQGLRKGGGVCIRGMNRQAIGKNS